MVRELMGRRFQIRLSHSSVCRWLGQMGWSAQRPVWRACQQDPGAVSRWKEEESPKLRCRARELGAEIFFGDEARAGSDFHSGKRWGRRGHTPMVSATGARFGATILSAVSARGQFRFMVTRERVTAAVFIQFLPPLMTNAASPVFLVVDNHPIPKAKSVKGFVQQQQGRLELHYLPACSPELNPDELVWNNLKNHTLGRTFIFSCEALPALVISQRRRMQQLPALIRSFFQAPTTRYATLGWQLL